MSKCNISDKTPVGQYENRGKPGFTKLGLPRKKLGRPRDVNKDLPLEEQRKVYREMHRKGQPLTVSQTAIAMWDPKTEKRPLTKVAVLKIEQRVLAKLKSMLVSLGINNLDDVFSPRREIASQGDLA